MVKGEKKFSGIDRGEANIGLWSWEPGLNPAAAISCVRPWGTLFNFSVLQFSHLQNGNGNNFASYCYYNKSPQMF